MLPFRVYHIQNCPSCQGLLNFLKEIDAPVEVIEIGGDPVIQTGIERIVGHFAVPVFVAFNDPRDNQGKIILGNNQEEIRGLVNAVLGISGTSAPNGAASAGESVQSIEVPDAPATTGGVV